MKSFWQIFGSLPMAAKVSGLRVSHFATLVNQKNLQALKSCNFSPDCETQNAKINLFENRKGLRANKEMVENASVSKVHGSIEVVQIHLHHSKSSSTILGKTEVHAVIALIKESWLVNGRYKSTSGLWETIFLQASVKIHECRKKGWVIVSFTSHNRLDILHGCTSESHHVS